MASPQFEPGPVNSGPTLSLNYTTADALALLVAAPHAHEVAALIEKAATAAK